MSQTKRKVFNTKVKALLLILIWTLIRRTCSTGNNNKNNNNNDDNNTDISNLALEAGLVEASGVHDGPVAEVAAAPEGSSSDNKANDNNILESRNDARQAVTEEQSGNRNDEGDIDCGDNGIDANNNGREMIYKNGKQEQQKNGGNFSNLQPLGNESAADEGEEASGQRKHDGGEKGGEERKKEMGGQRQRKKRAEPKTTATTAGDATAFNEDPSEGGSRAGGSPGAGGSDDKVPGAVADGDNNSGIENHSNASENIYVDSDKESAADVDGAGDDLSFDLQQKLIYDFAIKLKQIPRVTLFTCRVGNDNNRGRNNGNNGPATPATACNIKTIEILRRMYLPATRTTAAAAGAPPEPTTTTKTTATTSGRPTPKVDKDESNFLTVANVPGNDNDNDNSRGTGSVSGNDSQPKGILIKVVQIDQLINKRRNAYNSNRYSNNNNFNNNNYRFNGNNLYRRPSRAASGLAGARVRSGSRARAGLGSRGGDSSTAGSGARGGAGDRTSFSQANWLEEVVLRNDRLRQILVVDLSCGAASRKLIELASNKALFNARHHWLLIEEDFGINRRTASDYNNNNNENRDDNNENRDENNSNRNDNASAPATSDIRSATVAKRLGVAADGVVDAKLLPDNGEYVAGNRQQQRQRQQRRLNQQQTQQQRQRQVPAAEDDDMEIIEKFLEKIDINPNTELILARRTRAVAASVDFGATPGAGAEAEAEDVANKTLQRKDYYRLRDVWSPGLQYGGQLNISEIGNFSLDHGFRLALWYRDSTTITRRMDMKNARIRCSNVIIHKNNSDSLEQYLTTHYDTHLDSMNRFNYVLLTHVRDMFNFSLVLSKASSWGYMKNGNFDGMIGSLMRNQSDIGGSPIFFRIERAKVIDYTTQTWVARPCFIFRHPRSTTKDRIVFLQPFSNDVWILLGVCGGATIVLLWALTSVERKLAPRTCDEDGGAAEARTAPTRFLLPRPPPALAQAPGGATRTGTRTTTAVAKQTAAPPAPPGKGRGFRRRFVRCGNVFCGRDGADASQRRVGLFLESALFYIGSICQQGLAYSTSFFSGRCIVTTSLLFSFAIYQFYSASIVGSLLMEKPKTIRTLRDLIHSSLQLGIEDIIYNRDFFLLTKDPVAIELYAKKISSLPMSADPGFLPPNDQPPPTTPTTPPPVSQAKSYREILHSHESGAHAKTNEASNWFDPDRGMARLQKGGFAFHIDVATAYKIISDTFSEKEICDLAEIPLFPAQKMLGVVRKGSPLRKVITYGFRRVIETGLMDYQHKVWHSQKPRCVKQIHTDDLRVDLQTFASALLVLIFGFAASLLTLALELLHHKLWQRFAEED